ncbi:MAG: nitrogen regulation protein NR(II) [Gammaproteobacteria bacterium]|nr:nitrogen regulation protein NR(II) [Gammaproteobacteria bacterium]
MKLVPRTRMKPEVILDGMTTGVISVDADLRIAALNSACESLFGMSQKFALGEELKIAVPHLDGLLPRLRQALSTGSGFIEREVQLRRTGEASITVDCMVTPMMIARQPGLLLELAPLDRHLRISRDEWQAAQHEATRELVRGLAHEIKNPLGGIRGAAQLLEREFPDSQHREYTRVIIREVDRLQNLVNRLLGPNRLPAHNFLNVHEVIEHVRKLIEAEAPDGVSVQRDYDPSIPDVIADREQLIQAVLNVARNALQALDGHGQVMVRTRARRRFTIGGRMHKLVVQIDIEDDGPGIPPSLLEKIFYPMVTTRAEGSGLGLPISQHLIHTHGGLIECQSQPGCTVFSIYLPLERPL